MTGGTPILGKLHCCGLFSRRLSERILLGSQAKLHWASQLRLQWLHVEFATDHIILTPTAGLNVIPSGESKQKHKNAPFNHQSQLGIETSESLLYQ